MADKQVEAMAPPAYNDAMKQPATNPGMVQPPYPTQQPPYPQQGFAAPYPQQPGQPAYPPGQPGYPPGNYQQTYQTNYPPYPQQPVTQWDNQGFAQSQPTFYGNAQTDPGKPYPTSQPAAHMATHQAGMGGIIQGGYDSDVEGGGAYAGAYGSDHAGFQSFSDKAVRRGFIRKVYGILMLQLILTGGIIGAFMGIESLKLYTQKNQWIYFSSFGVMMVCMIAMVCCEGARRKAPTNYIFLGVFTAAEGLMLGSVCVYFEADAVLIAVGICAAVTLALTLFAFQTKIDFTNCGGMLCAFLMIVSLAGILMMFLPYNKWAMIGYGSAGALVFSLYIVYDTQLMMGGKHKYSLSPEEYVFAALSLYLDIINLFLYILMIIGAARGD